MKAWFSGSCHCAAVRFRCELDTSQPTSRCNCSICSKSRLWKAFVPGEAFSLLQGAASLTEYRFGTSRIAHMFCSHCGLKLFGHGGRDAFAEEFYAINIACLDDLPDDLRADLQVVYQDGRNDDWQSTPTQTALL